MLRNFLDELAGGAIATLLAVEYVWRWLWDIQQKPRPLPPKAPKAAFAAERRWKRLIVEPDSTTIARLKAATIRMVARKHPDTAKWTVDYLCKRGLLTFYMRDNVPYFLFNSPPHCRLERRII